MTNRAFAILCQRCFLTGRLSVGLNAGSPYHCLTLLGRAVSASTSRCWLRVESGEVVRTGVQQQGSRTERETQAPRTVGSLSRTS